MGARRGNTQLPRRCPVDVYAGPLGALMRPDESAGIYMYPGGGGAGGRSHFIKAPVSAVTRKTTAPRRRARAREPLAPKPHLARHSALAFVLGFACVHVCVGFLFNFILSVISTRLRVKRCAVKGDRCCGINDFVDN